MSCVGYINNAQYVDNIEVGVSKMKQLQCSPIHIEDKDDNDRLEWKCFLGKLNEGDAAVLLSFDNAFKNHTDLVFFLKYCLSRHIRIISLFDGLDTSDELFPNGSTRNVLSAIVNVRTDKRDEGFDDFEAELIADKHQEKKLKKYRMVINMYNAGYSIKEIMSRTGYHGKSNIYRILHMYNVEVEYPTMVRTRHQPPNIIQRNL